MSKPTMNPKTVKAALKVAGVMLAVALAVVAQWEAGAITSGIELVEALASAIAGSLNEQP
jgi:hypothetical protein